jgi:hypothetical protein
MKSQTLAAGFRSYVVNIAALLVCLYGVPAFSQTQMVIYPNRTSTSQRVSDIRGGNPSVKGPTEIKKLGKKNDKGGDGTLPDATVQKSFGALVNATPGAGFEGMNIYDGGYIPSDNNIAVGPNHIVEVVNTAYAVYSKTGAPLNVPTSIRLIWTGLGGACSSNDGGDPIVQYDRVADRWLITQLGNTAGPYSECIAVSTSPDPLGSYYLYEWGGFGNYLNDYPKFAIWPTANNSAYLATWSLFLFGQIQAGSQICAYDRAAMLRGDAHPMGICYQGVNADVLLPADLDGSTPPLDGTPAYFLNLYSYTSLALFQMKPNFTAGTSTLTNSFISIDSFSEAPAAVQPGTTMTLDSLGDRLMNRLAFRRFSDHESMVVNHAIDVSGHSGERWYELRAPVSANGSWTRYQQGTFSPDNNFRWMGSAAMDNAGNMALGYSVSSSTLYPSIRYTGRAATDPLNTLSSEASLWEGAGSQTGYSRWGDYTSMQIDPSDDCTFWYVNEYLPVTHDFAWHTRIGSFKFAGCGQPPTPDFSMSASPASLTLAQGSSGNSTITVTSKFGFNSSVALTVSGCPANATCGLNPTSVTPPSNSFANSTLSVATTVNTPTGPYVLTINGNDSGHSTTVSLTVNPPPDFTLSASPTSLTVAQGGSGNSTITATSKFGFSSSVALTVSGCPTNVTCTLNPTSVTPPSNSSASATLTINAAANASPGTYTLTINGNGAGHSTTVSLTISAASGFDISLSSSTLTVSRGANGSVVVNVTGSGSVTLSVSGVPSKTTASFSANPVAAPGNSALTITVNKSARAGTYSLVVTGKVGAVSHTAPLTLKIN